MNLKDHLQLEGPKCSKLFQISSKGFHYIWKLTILVHSYIIKVYLGPKTWGSLVGEPSNFGTPGGVAHTSICVNPALITLMIYRKKVIKSLKKQTNYILPYFFSICQALCGLTSSVFCLFFCFQEALLSRSTDYLYYIWNTQVSW